MINPDQDTKKIKLYIYHAAQCDPKRCTALKMLRLGLAKRIQRLAHLPRRCLVLDPYSNIVLTRSDCGSMVSHGLAAVDCSWENAEAIFNFKIRAERRRLPDMLAGNPINYGLKNKLSTVEAFAGALYVCGFSEQARSVLAKFKWGQNFLRINKMTPSATLAV